MTPQQPELRRSGHNAITSDAPPPRVPPPTGPDPEDAGKRAPKANRPGNRPKHEQDKPNPERVASKLRTRPWDKVQADESAALPKPLRYVAYGVGAVVGTGAKLAEEAWGAGGRLVRRVRGKR
jgi:hypothetical protein